MKQEGALLRSLQDTERLQTMKSGILQSGMYDAFQNAYSIQYVCVQAFTAVDTYAPMVYGCCCSQCLCQCLWNKHDIRDRSTHPYYIRLTVTLNAYCHFLLLLPLYTHYIQFTDRPHKLTHFQYTAWPDHGVPLHPSSLVKFVQEVRKVHGNSQAPMVVHCRWGRDACVQINYKPCYLLLYCSEFLYWLHLPLH